LELSRIVHPVLSLFGVLNGINYISAQVRFEPRVRLLF